MFCCDEFDAGVGVVFGKVLMDAVLCVGAGVTGAGPFTLLIGPSATVM
jgi:hypothetical protein